MMVWACATALLSTGSVWPQDVALKPSFLITSSSAKEYAFFDRRFAAAERDCGGQNVSPAIEWRGEPAETKSFAVVYFDPDGANGQGESKWVGYNIPPTLHSLPERAMTDNSARITVGPNDHGDEAYYGACPPYGKLHHYVFGVYALDIPVGTLKPGLNREALLTAMKGHTRAYQSIVFVYQRTPPANAAAQSGR
jgi:Raf kinase inhibitor-like YbhB/YbcL family protein